ncbi:MAG: glycosyltransferase family 4 protein [Bdellovibrionota bacterium]
MLYHNLDLPEAHITCGLKAAGFDLQIVCHPDSPHLEILEASGILPIKYAFKSRVSLEAIRKILHLNQSFKPDLIHAFSGKVISNTVLASYFIQSRPKIIAYRGTFGDISKFDPSNWLTFFNPRIDKIVCVAKYIANGFLKVGLNPDKVCTIYKGHDPKWYLAKRPKSRGKLGLPMNAFVIACVANMRKTKGIDILIEAAELLVDKIPNLHLVLVGEVYEASIKQKASQSSLRHNIHFTGYQQYPVDFHNLFDVFVMPSRIRDGLPKSVIEAMCSNLPCIVTDVGGLPELITDRENGLVVPQENPVALSMAIKLLAENKSLRTSYGINAHKSISQKFSVDSSVMAISDLYRLLN